MESSLIYWVQVEKNLSDGKFFDIKEMPQDLISTQVEFINLAIKHYKENK
jgi:hypothetical protein